MTARELRDPDQARRYLIQSLWLCRAAPLNKQSAQSAIRLAHEIASSGSPLLPMGFIADVAHIAMEAWRQSSPPNQAPPSIDPALLRKYEDYVLGKMYADVSFERGADALHRYQGRERDKALAFLIEQIRRRCELDGATLSPGVIKGLGPDVNHLLAEGWRSLEDEPVEELLADFGNLLDAVRTTGDLLGAEDIFELEHGTAMASSGQRLALRQTLAAAAAIEQGLPHHKPRSSAAQRQVATRMLDEDAYPVGGFSSISTRGSVESLLHSQLAYMERDERPDLFDVKFLRDELLYYSRDENQFLRRRRTFIFALHADLDDARVKDEQFPCQRLILTLALVVAVVRRLADWLGEDALSFEPLFVHKEGDGSLSEEQELMEALLREQIASQTAVVESISPSALGKRCDERARRSLCHCLLIATKRRKFTSDLAAVSRLLVDAPAPHVSLKDKPWDAMESDGMDGWREAAVRLLQFFV